MQCLWFIDWLVMHLWGGLQIETLLWNYGFLTSKTHFGKTLIPTQWQQMHSSTGPDVYKLERAIQVFNSTCISKLSIKTHEMPLPTSTNKAAANMTTFDSEACPSYFSWIRKDLDPWKESGISRTTLEKVKRHAAFRAIILNGMLYIDLYRRCFQTRALFTLWGLLLLLEKYKNRVPDVEFMFNCGDRPRARRANNQPAIPLFSYCSNHEFYDIPWPDWSFFGWYVFTLSKDISCLFQKLSFVNLSCRVVVKVSSLSLLS